MERIVIVMEGGVIQDIVNIPPGVEIEVRDFDIEATIAEELEETPDGEQYVQSLWGEC